MKQLPFHLRTVQLLALLACSHTSACTDDDASHGGAGSAEVQFQANVVDRDIYITTKSSAPISIAGSCNNSNLEKAAGRSWSPFSDERPNIDGSRYYLDGTYEGYHGWCEDPGCRTPSEDEPWASAYEYVNIGSRELPSDCEQPLCVPAERVPAIERRRVTGKVRVKLEYSLSDSCRGPLDALRNAYVEVTIPEDGMCCPVGPSGCSIGEPIGGWAASVADCSVAKTEAEHAYSSPLDAHGCHVLTQDGNVCDEDEEDAGVQE